MADLALKSKANTQNHVILSQKPAFRTGESKDSKLKGVEVGNNYAYCFESQPNGDSSVLSPEACQGKVAKASENQLPNLSVWGMDVPGMPDAKESGLEGLDEWEGVSKFQESMDSFDLDSTQLQTIEGARNASDNYALTDGNGQRLDIASDGLGRGISVTQGREQLEFNQEELGQLTELMRIGADNTGDAGEMKEAIDRIEQSKPLKY